MRYVIAWVSVVAVASCIDVPQTTVEGDDQSAEESVAGDAASEADMVMEDLGRPDVDASMPMVPQRNLESLSLEVQWDSTVTWRCGFPNELEDGAMTQLDCAEADIATEPLPEDGQIRTSLRFVDGNNQSLRSWQWRGADFREPSAPRETAVVEATVSGYCDPGEHPELCWSAFQPCGEEEGAVCVIGSFRYRWAKGAWAKAPVAINLVQQGQPQLYWRIDAP